MNRLADALSPYLQQHADNPVDWRPWGEEAMAEAKRRDVPLLISVGYAACHWCHVMAHESFEDDNVAAEVNALTVPVKVDREERPDVDAVYMQATLALTGQGGWPMTVFATPDGTPFFAGTYFPRQHFLRLLDAVAEAWTERREEVLAQGNVIVEACAKSGPPLEDVTQACPIDGPCPPVSPIALSDIDKAIGELYQNFDRTHGGFGGAPKFPTEPVLSFLADRVAYGRANPESSAPIESGEMLRHTARCMARGGIYDQLGGGFARYSVDETWTVPHFEKMLYDNAGLLSVYTALATDEDAGPAEQRLFARVADETARFMIDVLGTPQGGFASALDADTDGTEGATYVWTPPQLAEVLGAADGEWAAELFAVTEAGTFEHGASVLQLPRDPVDAERYERVRASLWQARQQRRQPDRDDKVVAAWNGMAVSALTEYARQRPQWSVPGPGDVVADAESAAQRAATLLAEVHVVDGRLRRVSRDGRVGAAAGILEDYGAVTTAFLARYHVTGDVWWLQRAKPLVETIVEQFTGDIGQFFDTAADAESLVTRPADPTDGPTPAGWALGAEALRAYAAATGEENYKDDAWRALATVASMITQYPRFAAGTARVALRMVV